MWAQAVPVLLGFVLTTLAGGLYADRLHGRSWRHRNDLRRAEEDARHAGEVCRALSALLDRRLYRMRRLLSAVLDVRSGRASRAVLAARLRDYDRVLLEWNDELNARLAVVGAYFGADLRDLLDGVVYEKFADTGRQLEALYRSAVDERQVTDPAPAADAVRASIDALGHLAYDASFTMMVRIREGRVGRRAPGVLGEAAVGRTRGEPR